MLTTFGFDTPLITYSLATANPQRSGGNLQKTARNLQKTRRNLQKTRGACKTLEPRDGGRANTQVCGFFFLQHVFGFFFPASTKRGPGVGRRARLASRPDPTTAAAPL